ncbi:hypothetical protein CEXT_174901 [Caerostris extrusa]|uniref:Uncharacterized protein n=1 Tax=Caerostris extrusa TaxID=172846 RepID=A0AAV4RW05_CAEEX|nr:hypothetical protein CEXT_174901 [Caerostris extrusa]
MRLLFPRSILFSSCTYVPRSPPMVILSPPFTANSFSVFKWSPAVLGLFTADAAASYLMFYQKQKLLSAASIVTPLTP